MTRPAITRHATMGEVLEAYPSAQRALFRGYHIGGCNSCGYAPARRNRSPTGATGSRSRCR